LFFLFFYSLLPSFSICLRGWAMETPAEFERLLDGLHEWRDVQGVVRTTFHALCDVAHEQTKAVRDVERKLGEVYDELMAKVGQKADAASLRSAEATAHEARTTAELAAKRVEEEVVCARDAQKVEADDMQALRASLTELRVALERQRADVQLRVAGLEAGLVRLATECSTGEAERELADSSAVQQQEVNELRSAIEEKATPAQLQEIVREAWHTEEGHIARIQRICDSKVSAGELAAVAALAEGKASISDLDAVVQHQVSRRLGLLITEQQLLGKNDVASIADAVGSDLREQLRGCEHRLDELGRRQQRMSVATDSIRTDLRMIDAAKLERAEAEALVAGALGE